MVERFSDRYDRAEILKTLISDLEDAAPVPDNDVYRAELRQAIIRLTINAANPGQLRAILADPASTTTAPLGVP